MYIIRSVGIENDLNPYLLWQTPTWDEDGFFWTSKETMQKCIADKRFMDNCKANEKQFLFDTADEAIAYGNDVVKLSGNFGAEKISEQKSFWLKYEREQK